MHEAAIAQSLIEIIQQEMAKAKATRLLSATVVHGRLTNLVPEALSFAFEAMTMDTPLAGATLHLRQVPLVVRCFGCGEEFTPEDDNLLLMPCPKCGEEFGHTVVTGKELYLETIEAE
ncbi:MAG: hydrogenase maturation nickel metallochaperone HypA [Desulfovibrionaceae bacterium]|jgi:hydrogenase nickel incorporation protein HypA/HybF|nr:hydrogenase maturation nickel metallochaperone HypA [Desulfovibrionaceae bacterium]